MFLAVGLLLTITGSLFAQTVDEVITKHIAAIGGKENWLKVSSVVMEGNLSVMGQEIPMKFYQLHNKGSKQEFSFGGMTGFSVNTPTSGYNFNPFQGQTKPEPMTEEEVKEKIDDLDLQGALIDYKAKGHTVELAGDEEIEGTECFKLIVNAKNGGVDTYFIDKTTYYIIRTSSKTKAMGQEVDVVVDMSNYKDVNGVKLPFSMSIAGQGNITMTSIKINEPVSEDTFKVAQ